MSKPAKNLNEILEKLNEIDNVFKFGEKMIPVIEGFVSFISDFLPFVEQVSGSIQDTKSKIPEASNQIDKVTNATELAMTEVLDKIDEISQQLESINDSMDSMLEKRVLAEESANRLRILLGDNFEAKDLLDEILNNLDFGLSFELVKNKIGEITASTDQITMSLQVQDITAQQLAAVNHLIISVQHKLGELLETVDSAGYDKTENLSLDKLPNVHFDANASYKTHDNKQDDVDSIIKKEQASQEEIDKLFS